MRTAERADGEPEPDPEEQTRELTSVREEAPAPGREPASPGQTRWFAEKRPTSAGCQRDGAAGRRPRCWVGTAAGPTGRAQAGRRSAPAFTSEALYH